MVPGSKLILIELVILCSPNCEPVGHLGIGRGMQECFGVAMSVSHWVTQLQLTLWVNIIFV